jgi:ppGpp synthetase/RelA/SpoT-type nucleotidyltranferase
MPDDLAKLYFKRQNVLEKLRKQLEHETIAALKNLPHIDRVAFRVKGPDSFLKKANDPKNRAFYKDPLSEIEDQIAGRIITFFLSDIPIVKDRLIEGTFSVAENWTRAPDRDAEFGYETEHLILMIPVQLKPRDWDKQDRMPTTFELQIRTIFMHAYAEPQHDIAYKGAEDLPKEVRRQLGWIAASSWGADQAYERVKQSDEERKHAGPMVLKKL